MDQGQIEVQSCNIGVLQLKKDRDLINHLKVLAYLQVYQYLLSHCLYLKSTLNALDWLVSARDLTGHNTAFQGANLTPVAADHAALVAGLPSHVRGYFFPSLRRGR